MTELKFKGRFISGKRPIAQPVDVLLGATAIIIKHAATGDALRSWLINDLQSVTEPELAQDLIFTSGQWSDERLYLQDHRFLKLISYQGARPGIKLRSFLPAFRGMALVACIVAGLGFVFHQAARPIAQLIPFELEASLGARVAQDVEQFFALDQNVIQHCVSEPGLQALAKILAVLDANDGLNVDYAVRVLSSDTPNALALPGGTIIILSGIFELIDDPDILSGVLAHEVGHVIKKHGTENMIRALGLSALVSIALGDASGSIPALVVEQTLSTANSRSFEREADRLGLAMLENAGYDATGLPAFFELLATEFELDKESSNWFSTHPRSSERAAYLSKAKTGPSILSDQEWADLKNICSVKQDAGDNSLKQLIDQTRERMDDWGLRLPTRSDLEAE